MIGEVIELNVGNFAHGGHCVARIDGRVVFVRHTLPGERVRARVTGSGGGGKFLRADAIEILEAAPDRVTPPCSYAGVCGGCDWQHASLDAQRRGKESIVRELLRKNVSAEILESFTVRAVEGDVDGLGWRTRVRFAVDSEGHAGLRPHRSHDVLTIDRCLIAHPAITALDITAEVWPQAREVLAVAPSSGEALAQADPRHTGTRVLEKAAGREWKVDFTGFWQVHPGAADALVNVVGDFAQPTKGEH
ncbi:MAG: TRAM domain-containing protein, partial [Actinobacteria bacterium]|nr:TRAM domain-containing protein [Actinomycetota bacterium]